VASLGKCDIKLSIKKGCFIHDFIFVEKISTFSFILI
jgi:hypothetical protein